MTVPRIGVLLVHGIGESAQSATLREFAAPIVSWLTDWHSDPSRTGSVELLSSRLSYGGQLQGAPAHFELLIDSPVAQERREIVFAEGWWAANLSAPAPLEVIGWSFGVLARVALQLATAAVWRRRAVWKHVARGGTKPNSLVQRVEAAAGILVEYTSQLLLAIAYLPAAVGGYLVLIPLALLIQIPIPQLQQFVLVRVLRPLLVDYIGDFEVYTHDEIQALNVRAAVERAADWLAGTGGCDSICVIAHSQGAVVAYDAIAAQACPGMARVSKLITMGGALNRAWSLGQPAPRLLRPLPSHVRWVDMWSSYDPVPGGPLIRPGQAVNQEVTNGMNVLTDHGGYFHNREEVISRLIQEIDVSGPHTASRFCFADQDLRVRRRWVRTMTLVSWRLIAMFLFALVAIRREPLLLSDGRATWRLLENVPGVAGLGDAIAAALDGVSATFLALSSAIPGTPILEKASLVIGIVLAPGTLEPLFKVVLALAVIAAVFGAVYLATTWALYAPWVRDDARTAVAPRLPAGTKLAALWAWTRAVAVPAIIGLLALGLRAS